MRHPGQDITSLLLVAGVLAPPFVSHSIHRQSAGMIPLDLKSPCTSLGFPLMDITAERFAGMILLAVRTLAWRR